MAGKLGVPGVGFTLVLLQQVTLLVVRSDSASEECKHQTSRHCHPAVRESRLPRAMARVLLRLLPVAGFRGDLEPAH